MFYAAEAIRGRPLPPRAQEMGYRAGFALLITLFVFATWNDLSQFGLFPLGGRAVRLKPGRAPGMAVDGGFPAATCRHGGAVFIDNRPGTERAGGGWRGHPGAGVAARGLLR